MTEAKKKVGASIHRGMMRTWQVHVDGEYVAGMIHKKRHARRIMACLNHCRGKDTGDLERQWRDGK